MRNEDELEGDDEQALEEGVFVRLRLDEVRVNERKNVRAPYSAEEIASRAEALSQQPMLHPPTVFERRGGGFELVTGYGRYLALRHLEVEEAVFRLIAEPDRRTRLLLMGSENLVRKEMSSAERVEYVWQLVERERLAVEEVASHLGLASRYVRSLVSIRRKAHPELWDAFVKERVPIRQMLNVVSHLPEVQMQRLRDGQVWHRRAEVIEQGFVDSPEGQSASEWEEEDGFLSAYESGSLPSFAPRGGAAKGKRRRLRERAPSVREHRQLLEVLEEEEKGLDPKLVEGMRRVLRWSAYGEDIEGLSATAYRRVQRNQRRRERRAERKAEARSSESPPPPASPIAGTPPAFGPEVGIPEFVRSKTQPLGRVADEGER